MSATHSPPISPSPISNWTHTSKGRLGFGLFVVLLINGIDVVMPPLGIPLAVLAIWLMLRKQGFGWVDLGFARPKSWLRTIALGVVIGIAVNVGLSFGLGPLLERLFHQELDASRFDALRGDLQQFLMYLTVSWTTAGFGEEIIWRGFFLVGMIALLGGDRRAEILSLVAMMIAFGLIHFYQGPIGIVSTGIAGLIFGILFLRTGKNIWLPIIVHGVIDTMSFAMLYTGIGV